ncbi:MAG: NADH:ubiquinone reductase (Na(+)-transporting) subunit C [Porphyromonadaceae bacterium]|nr:NADH:ubiquinone reductase (Na(+)-transporting) subunit C [Porphyromonadaceae bacterium]
MDTNKNSYTFIYAIIMVVVVALMLALVSGALKERQTTNVELDRKKQILSSINIDIKGQDIEALFDKYIPKALIITGKETREESGKAYDMTRPLEDGGIPVYIADIDGQTKYILSAYGAGLWGPIWGYVALNDDKNTVYGTYFAHASETPGLGAEIANKQFQDEFIGKKILNDENKFVSIAIVKPGQQAADRDYVDGISGGTITSKGVEDMIYKSIIAYESFLEQTSQQ